MHPIHRANASFVILHINISMDPPNELSHDTFFLLEQSRTPSGRVQGVVPNFLTII